MGMGDAFMGHGLPRGYHSGLTADGSRWHQMASGGIRWHQEAEGP